MSNLTPSGSGGVTNTVLVSSEISSYTVQNVSVPLANTEVSITLGSDVVWFEVYNRTGGRTKVGFGVGDSGTLYSTLESGDAHEYTKKAGSALTIYVQCPKAGQLIEVQQGHT